jgi:16S rRNA (guanine(966)-N(2))-methyltransferase RsmD
VRTKGSNAVRIIGGEWRSRVIRFPAAANLRPTPDFVRERLFNWLGQDLSGKRCLDLFAGSGALGFEALSRGAAEVVMVESSRLVHRNLQATAGELGAGQRLRLVPGDALHFLASPPHRFDVVSRCSTTFRERLLPARSCTSRATRRSRPDPVGG